MKFSFSIAIFLFAQAGILFGQPLNEMANGEPLKVFDCEGFVKLVEGRNYQRAKSALADQGSFPCSNMNAVKAQARLHAAYFEYDEAEAILENLVNENPDNQELHREWTHMVDMLSSQGSFKPVDVRPTAAMSYSSSVMVAWMNEDAPQLLKNHVAEPEYFPIKKEKQPVMQFDVEDIKENPRLYKISRKLKKRRFEEIGPGTFMPDSSLIITAVQRLPFAGNARAEKLKLVIFDAEANYHSTLSFGNSKTSVAYPAYRSADSTMFFASDLEGGFGGMDLWKSKFDGKDWLEPRNLGEGINSDGDEILPTLSGDTLFFSSNRAYEGFGGFDIYAHVFSEMETSNLGLPINGPYDEHSFYTTDRGKAIIISNREGDIDRSDIYSVKWSVPDEFFESLSGQLIDAGEQVGREVHLVAADGSVVQKTVVGDDGSFVFKHIHGKETYKVVLPDVELEQGSRLKLFDKDKKLISDVKSDSGSFEVVLLSPIDYVLDKIEEEDESILSVDILGMMDNESETKSGVKIKLTNGEGEVIATTYTGDRGDFKFESVSPDERYNIEAEELDSESTVHIVNERGDIIASIDPTDDGDFVYVRLDPDDGVITVTNEYNKKVRISNKDLFDLGVVNYELNSVEISAESETVLNKLSEILLANPRVGVELSGHTDSRGADAYNMELSQQRIESAISYLETLGVERKRLKGKGYGESDLKNHCANGVECSEEEHAENRRTEFRLWDDK
ncbi:MAG: OmpA family protein [Cryomorphaceae bacterium]